MPCSLLVMARDNPTPHPDADRAREGSYRKGYPVVCKSGGPGPWGSAEGLPDFIQLYVTDDDGGAFAKHIAPWTSEIDWEIVNQDLSVDGFRLRLFVTNRRSRDGLGDISLNQAESYLTKWNAQNISGVVPHGVQFDVAIYGAATSEGFWGQDPVELGITFVELTPSAGDPAGTHDIRANYPATLAHVNIRGIIASLATVIGESEGARTIDYRVTRAAVQAEFKSKIKDTLEQVIQRRQLYLSASYVDSVIAAGGVATTTKAELKAAEHNAMDD